MIEDGDLVNAHEALVGLHFQAEALDLAARKSTKGHQNNSDHLDNQMNHNDEGDWQYEVVKSFLSRLSQTNAMFEELLFEHFTQMVVLDNLYVNVESI